jgi:NTE family protein
MSVDALLASACVPDLFPPVMLDGEWYWDGGYGGNPTLWPMIRGGAASDLIIVQLLRDRVEELPAGPIGIRRRVDEIVFNSSLFAEMQAIDTIRRLASSPDVRLHRIGPPRGELFDRGSGIDRTRAWIELLHRQGRAAGRLFMARHGMHIGFRETLDVAQLLTQPVRFPPNQSSSILWKTSGA